MEDVRTGQQHLTTEASLYHKHVCITFTFMCFNIFLVLTDSCALARGRQQLSTFLYSKPTTVGMKIVKYDIPNKK